MKLSRPQFPSHLKEIRSLMPQLLKILEDGRKDDWYSFVWLEENKSCESIAAINESASENLDRGLVLRVLVDGINFEKSTNLLDPQNLIQMAKDFRAQLDTSFPTVSSKSYRPPSWSEEDFVKFISEKIIPLLSGKEPMPNEKDPCWVYLKQFGFEYEEE